MKKGHNEIADLVREKIAKCQPFYEAKYFSQLPPGVRFTSPNLNQLRVEFDRSVIQLNDINQSHIHGLLERVEDMLVGGKLTEDEAAVLKDYIWPAPAEEQTLEGQERLIGT